MALAKEITIVHMNGREMDLDKKYFVHLLLLGPSVRC